MNIPKDVSDALAAVKAVHFPTGSRFICDPPPTDTDEDFLVLVPSGSFDTFAQALDAAGFEWDHGEGYIDRDGGTFASFRREALNLIVTEDDTFADRHRAATHVCKKLNLLKKSDRVMVFQAVLYGAWEGEN